MHLSPGTATLLGTGIDDRLRIEHGFTVLLGGRGRNSFEGSAAARQTEKFYGGEGDDIFRWSPGFNIVHGGQPQLGYMSDGTDVIDYSGAGEVAITFKRHWIPHKVPNYVAVFEGGVDQLFSVERIQWNAKTDRIALGKGINLLEDDRVLQPSSSLGVPNSHSAALTTPDATAGARLLGTAADDVIEATMDADTLYGGEGDDTLIGVGGADGYVYLPGDGIDVIIDTSDGAVVLMLTSCCSPAASRPTRSRCSASAMGICC